MARRHQITVLGLPGICLLDLASAVQVFSHCASEHYSLTIAGLAVGPIETSTGIQVMAQVGLEGLRNADTVVVTGSAPNPLDQPAAAVEAVREAHRRGARVASICTGAFTLAAAGLLDGRRAATHWMDAPTLAATYPQIDVDPCVLYVDEGDVLTSAGVAAGLDLCLHIVRRDLGAEVAAAIARRTVVPPHREADQAQYVTRPVAREPGGSGAHASSLEATRAWALAHLNADLSVAALARHARVSTRTLARRFVEETGTTPTQWVIEQRLRRAQSLLENTSDPVEDIARAAGFGDAAVLRSHMRQRLHTTPQAYRTAFAGRAAS